MRLISLLIGILLLAACQPDPSGSSPGRIAGPPEAFSEAAKRAAETISRDVVYDAVSEIASDAYEGRGPGSAGDVKARRYLAEQLAGLGFKPGAADGGWEQPFDLVGVKSAQPSSWTFSRRGEAFSLRQSEEFIVGSGKQQARSAIDEAEVVFVGYGIQAPEFDWDDFKGADLSGKVLVMLNNDPDWDPELFAGETRLYYGRWTYKYESAARQGAAGAIIVHTADSAGYPWQVVQTSWTGEQFELPAGHEPRIEVAGWVTQEAAGKIFALAGQDLEALVESARSRAFRPVPLGVTTSIAFDNSLRDQQSANVLGLLEGSDPRLREEVVVYTAHHDHLGIGLADPNVDPADTIYNGARDNAAGTGMVLAIARAFAALPQAPRRSVLIAFVGAEEQGLLGSRYFARHPTFPAGRIAANINFDGPNIWGATRDIGYVGKGKSTLDAVAETVAAHEGRYVVPDQFPDKGYFYRSDQFPLAAVGVPALYLKGGTDFPGKPEGWGAQLVHTYTQRDYHQPSDELTDEWDFSGMVADARFGFWAGLIIANAEQMPSWYPGDEFEAARLEALEAVATP